MDQKQYWIASGEQSIGPLSEDAVRGLLSVGKIQSDDRAWHTGLEEWRELSQILPPPPPAPSQQRNVSPSIAIEAKEPTPPERKDGQQGESQSLNWLWVVIGVAGVGFKVWLHGSVEHGLLAPFAGVIALAVVVVLIAYASKGGK